MKPTIIKKVTQAGGLAAMMAALALAPNAKANVYATGIKINSTLTGTATNSVGAPVSISYHLNDNASAVTVKIIRSNSVVASFAGTTNLGVNSVSWTPTNAGNFSVSITASSAGYPTWQQISPLTTNYVAVFPQGLAVDKNTNSPYYGRVVVGCAASATQHGIAQQCGFYKYNADGTPADEGIFGFAGYTTNDYGHTSTGQMPATSGSFQINNPSCIRIGEDDRIYWADNTDGGAIVACDMLATTNQVVICTGNSPSQDVPGKLVGPTYANSPAATGGNLNNNGYGWVAFDIINTGTASTYTGSNGVYTGGQAALILCDWGDFPSQGSWMWHLVGAPGSMTADPTDTYGQQVVNVGSGADSLALRTDGIALDYKLNIFAGENRNNAGDPAARAAAWTSWNGGILPPGDQGGAQGGGFNYAETGGALWTEGSGSSASNDLNVIDVVLNSKANPTLMARTHSGSHGLGLDLLVPLDPSISITGDSLNGNTLTINCVSSSPYAPIASQLSLVGSANVAGPYSPVAATFTGSNGVFKATTTTSGSTGFYKVVFSSVAGTIVNGSIVTIKSTGNVTNTLDSIDNTGVYYWDAAFDNVGNLYGGDASDNYWRVWSPPGPNTNTTVAVVTLTAQ